MKLSDWVFASGRAKRKTLTAVLCNHNNASTLEASLRAYIAQRRRPDRLIVWDDCSSDESMQIIEKACRDDPWVEAVRNAKNVGHLFNCAMALQTCQTDYIYFGASDDLVSDTFFDCAMSSLEHHPEAGVLFSNYAFWDIRSNSITKYTIPFGTETRFFDNHSFLNIVENESTFVFPSHTVIVKVEELLKAGGFIPGFGARMDWFYQLVIAFRAGVVFSPNVTAQYTVGQDQSFSSVELANEAADYKCLGKMLELLSSARYRDVRDRFFVHAVLRGAPAMLPRLARLIYSEEKYAPFRRYSIIRETMADVEPG
jgi:hypothetical protein